jgi:hypothetical protein
MIYLSRKTSLRCLGGFWLLGGSILLAKGLRLVSLEGLYEGLFLVSALLLGWLKAQTVFRKVAYKMSERLALLPEPVALWTALGWRFALIVAAATCMGQLVQHSGLPDNWRGLIDITVGVALSLGSLWCFAKTFPGVTKAP